MKVVTLLKSEIGPILLFSNESHCDTTLQCASKGPWIYYYPSFSSDNLRKASILFLIEMKVVTLLNLKLAQLLFSNESHYDITLQCASKGL